MTQAASNPPLHKDLSQVQLRPTRLEDYEQVERLESSHGLLTLSKEDWRNIWLENPLRPRLGEGFPFGWVLEEAGGRIVGQLSNVPTLYTLGQRELIAVTGRAWVVASEYRGVALWLMDEYFNQPGVDLYINTTVNALAVEAFTSFGSARVPLGDWEHAAYWITNYTGFARTALRLKNLSASPLLAWPVGTMLRVRDFFRAKLPAVGARGLNIESLNGIDERFDVFWQELKRANPNRLLCQRDSRTLNWHFSGPRRSGNLWIFGAMAGGLLRAYCIFKRQDHPQSGLARMRLVDYQFLEGSDCLPALVAAALERCRREKIHSLEHVGCALPKMAAFDQYAPYRRLLPAWPFYFHAVDTALNERLRDPALWDPSAFDGDASL